MKKESQNPRFDSKPPSSQTMGQRNRLEVLAEEYAALKRAGKSVSLEQYAEEHPELADEIRELFPMLELLDHAVATPENQLTATPFSEFGSGTRLGEYELIRPIGRGGMGVVYQAEHVVLGSSAAVKLLPTGLNRPKLRERFQREASAAARMHHPNIVRVFDYGVHGETRYYVMELVEGCGLNQIISPIKNSLIPGNVEPSIDQANEETGKTIRDQQSAQTDTSNNDFEIDSETLNTTSQFDRSKFATSGPGQISLWHWVARIGVQAADALDYAHTTGVIHRDIKPSNLMIDTDEKIYVMDFGLAKVVDDNSLTATGDILGTIRYMPPEAFNGQSDCRCDIYGLGLVLYELLTGQVAFDGSARGELMDAISKGRIESLKNRLPAIPQDLHTIVHKSLDVDTNSRYQSAAEFRDDLQRFIQGQPIEARRSTWRYRTNRWISRNRTVATLLALTVLSLCVGLAVSSIGWSRALRAEADAVELSKKEKVARQLAQSESDAKQIALENEVRERRFAEAITNFVKLDLLGVSSVEGQQLVGLTEEFALAEEFGLDKDSTLKDLVRRALERLNRITDMESETQAGIYHLIGESLLSFGEYEKAIEAFRNGDNLYETTVDRSDGATSSLTEKWLTIRVLLAEALRKSGQVEQSIKILNKTRDDVMLLAADDSFNATQVLLGLGHSFHRKGDFKNSLSYYEQAHANYASSFGDRHLATLLTAGFVAVAKMDLDGRLDMTPKLESIVEEITDLLGEDDHAILLMRNSLGVAYWKQGRYSQAIGHLKAVVDNRDSVFGTNHPSTLNAKANLGVNYSELGNTEKAIPILQDVVERSATMLGNDDLKTIQYTSYLAKALESSGKLSESLLLHEHVLNSRVRLLGRKHRATIHAIQRLGFARAKNGEFKLALQHYRECLDLLPKMIDEEDESAIAIQYLIGSVLAKIGDHDLAIPILKKTLDWRENFYGLDHSKTVSNQRTLADVFRATRQFDRELPMRESIYKNTRARRGPEDSQTLIEMSYLAQCYANLNRHEDVVPILERLIAANSKKYGLEFGNRSDAITRLAMSFWHLGRKQEAESLLTDFIQSYRKAEKQFPRSESLLLADLQISMKKLEELRSHINKHLDLARKKYSSGSDDMNYLLDMFARKLFATRQYEQARTLFQEIIDSEPKDKSEKWRNHVAEVLLGQTYVDEIKFQKGELSKFTLTEAENERLAKAELRLTSGYEGLLQQKLHVPGNRGDYWQERAVKYLVRCAVWSENEEAKEKWKEIYSTFADLENQGK